MHESLTFCTSSVSHLSPRFFELPCFIGGGLPWTFQGFGRVISITGVFEMIQKRSSILSATNSFALFAFLLSVGAAPSPSPVRKSLLPLLPHRFNPPSTESSLTDRDESERMSAQRELAGVPLEVRRWLPWEVQIEYSGETFFDG